MRTTLTLDDDVANLLEQFVQDSGVSFKEAVNQALRRGFVARPEPKPLAFRTKRMGLRKGVRLDCVASLLEGLDTPREG